MKRLVSASLAIALAFAGISAVQAKSIVIKLGHNGNTIKEDPQNVAAQAFKKVAEESSKGDIKVQVYPSAQLGDARTMVEGIQMGTIEMADLENGVMGNFIPEVLVWDLPYVFTSLDSAHKVLDGPIGQALAKKYLDIGIRHLCYNDGGFRYFTNKVRPIVKPEDLKDLKIRVMESEVMVASVKSFGASAMPMAFGELYTALQQGVVDGQENPMNLIFSQRFYEVQKYLSLSGHFYYPRQYLVSEAFWKKLDKGQQDIVEKAAREACKVQRATFLTYEATMADVLRKHGMEINEVPLATKQTFAASARETVYPMFYQKIGRGDAKAGQDLISKVLEAAK